MDTVKELIWTAVGAVILLLALVAVMNYADRLSELDDIVHGSGASSTVAFVSGKEIRDDGTCSVEYVFGELLDPAPGQDMQVGGFVLTRAGWDMNTASAAMDAYSDAECFTRECIYDTEGRLVRIIYMPVYGQQGYLR